MFYHKSNLSSGSKRQFTCVKHTEVKSLGSINHDWIIVKRLGLGLGTWDLGIESRIENRKSRIETTPSPSADSKISWATTHHPPITF